MTLIVAEQRFPAREARSNIAMATRNTLQGLFHAKMEFLCISGHRFHPVRFKRAPELLEIVNVFWQQVYGWYVLRTNVQTIKYWNKWYVNFNSYENVVWDIENKPNAQRREVDDVYLMTLRWWHDLPWIDFAEYKYLGRWRHPPLLSCLSCGPNWTRSLEWLLSSDQVS